MFFFSLKTTFPYLKIHLRWLHVTKRKEEAKQQEEIKQYCETVVIGSQQTYTKPSHLPLYMFCKVSRKPWYPRLNSMQVQTF